MAIGYHSEKILGYITGSKGSDSIENIFFKFLLEMNIRSLEKLLKYKGIYMALFSIESDPIGSCYWFLL